MEDTTDLLQIKIEKAKRELSLETVNAIDAVDWKAAIIGFRSKYGYTFEQLGDLELETELLLSGLIRGEDYPKELENRLKITRSAANELVNEMNSLVFKKIQEELIKNTERKKIFQVSVRSEKNDNPPQLSATREEGNKTDTEVLNSAGIEIVPDLPAQTEKLELTEIPAHASAEEPLESREEMLEKIEKPASTREIELTRGGPETVPSILTQKLSGSVQIGMVKTEHSLENITPTSKGVGAPTENVGTKIPKIDPYREIPE